MTRQPTTAAAMRAALVDWRNGNWSYLERRRG